MRITLNQECQKKSEEMYQGLMHAIATAWQGECRLRETGKFPGLDLMITNSRCDGDKMEALVRLTLPELRWIESQMWRLSRVFLDQTDVLDPDRKTASILVTVETILWKVLDAFSEKYLDGEDEDKLSFLTLDEDVLNANHGQNLG